MRIGLWGRSMGAVTAIMYGSRDPSVRGPTFFLFGSSVNIEGSTIPLDVATPWAEPLGAWAVGSCVDQSLNTGGVQQSRGYKGSLREHCGGWGQPLPVLPPPGPYPMFLLCGIKFHSIASVHEPRLLPTIPVHRLRNS